MPALVGLVFTYDWLFRKKEKKKKAKKTNCHMSQKTFPMGGGGRRKTPNINKPSSDVTTGVCLQFRLCGRSGFVTSVEIRQEETDPGKQG